MFFWAENTAPRDSYVVYRRWENAEVLVVVVVLRRCSTSAVRCGRRQTVDSATSVSSSAASALVVSARRSIALNIQLRCRRGLWTFVRSDTVRSTTRGLVKRCVYECHTVASLELVSPGPATDGVTPIFPHKTDTLFCSSLSLLWFHSGVTPLEDVTPDLFYLSDLVTPLFFVNSATNFYSSGCHLPWRVSPGTVLPAVP